MRNMYLSIVYYSFFQKNCKFDLGKPNFSCEQKKQKQQQQ